MFDPMQLRLLQAMGYQLWQQAPAGAVAPSPAGAAPAASPPAQAASVRPAAAAPARPEAEGRVATPADRLWNAVLAAAALSPERAEHNRVRRAASGVPFEYLADELWIDPQALARQPRAKRTLWKTLRALRRAELARRP